MPTPSLTPCACCGPGALTPKGAIVTVAGVKNTPYPDCEECPEFNSSYVIEFPVDGCGYAASLVVCGGASVELGLGTDPNNSCRRRWHVRLFASGAGVDSHFGKNDICCCYTPVSLIPEDIASETCDFSEATVDVTPFGDWTQEEIANLACLPALAQACPTNYPLPIPETSTLSQELDSICSCRCSSPGPQPHLPTATSCSTCSTGETTSPVNGNLSLSVAMPSSGSMAPTERFFYNLAPIFGPDSPYADTLMQSPVAGSNVSGLHAIRLIISGSPETEANTVRCDGSINFYRCKDAVSHAYEPVGNRNSLLENVDGSNVRTGWTEITQPDRFRYEYNDTGILKYIQNPAGQRWTMTRSGTSLVSIIDPLTRRTSFVYSSGKLSRIQDIYGRITSLTVDANGNLTQFITPELCTTVLRYGSGYASSHQLIALIDSSGVQGQRALWRNLAVWVKLRHQRLSSIPPQHTNCHRMLRRESHATVRC